MFDLLPAALLSAAIAALVTHFTAPAVARLAPRVGGMDYPGERSFQRSPVPRIGGVAIVLGFVVGAGCTLLGLDLGPLRDALGRSQILSIGLATFIIFLVGLVDDLVGVSVFEKFCAQLAAAWLVVEVGWVFEVVRLPFVGTVELGALQGLVTILWLVGVTNAINFVDGLDGLAGGVVAIISSSFLIYALMQGRVLTVVWVAAIVGACIGFLGHNWEPARIYMGDSGALTLGFLLAIISVHSALKAPATIAVLVPILALGVPVIDTLLVMRLRFGHPEARSFSQRFQRMFRADRHHLHHLLLLRAGGRRRRIVAAIYSIVLLSCIASLVVAVQRNPVLGVLLVVVELVVVVCLRRLGFGGMGSGDVPAPLGPDSATAKGRARS